MTDLIRILYQECEPLQWKQSGIVVAISGISGFTVSSPYSRVFLGLIITLLECWGGENI